MRRVFTTIHWVFFVLVGIAACGGSDDAGLTTKGSGGSSGSGGDGGALGGSAGTTSGGSGGEPDGGSAGVGVGGTSTGGSGGTAGLAGAGGEGALGGSGGSGNYTIDNVCAQLPQLVCQSRANCCNKTYGYNQANCESIEKQECDQMVAEVKAGDRTFDPTMIDVCLGALQPLLATCVFDGKMTAALYKASNTCGKIFPGTGTPGSPCTMQSDCAPSADPNGYFGCSTQNNQCYQGTILSLGAPCNYYLNVCDTGLDCATPMLSTQEGTCAPVTPTGGACTSSNQCGFGNYCTSSLCQVAKETGSCSNFHHCVSLNCQGGQCAAPAPIIRQADCGS